MISEYSKKIYESTYFLPTEDYETWLDRMTIDRFNSDIDRFDMPIDRLERIKYYIENQWFHPATPISSNLGTTRGLAISCFVREVDDSKEGIFYSFNEGFWLGSDGTGIGTNWSDVRSVGEPIADGLKGTTSGIIPFLGISDRSTLAISQGAIRRGAEAVFLDISHPEIEEFINIRKPDREPNRACPNLHHGVIISDEFMNAVEERKMFDLRSPKTGKVVKSVDAFKLFCSILDVRTRFQGEPYLYFIDNANKNKSRAYKELDLDVSMTNLCTEINLNTSKDKSNICCLASLNLAKWDEYKDDIDVIVEDCLDYLDCIVECFIKKVSTKVRFKGNNAYKRALKGALEDRPLGLGIMGFHTYLQSKMIPFEALNAKAMNEIIFSKIYSAVGKYELNCSKPACINGAKLKVKQRNLTHTAIAPTMSISNLCNFVSQGIEPIMSNYYSKKIKQGTFFIKNEILDKYMSDYYDTHKLEEPKELWLKTQWNSIRDNEGSVQHLDWMPSEDKDVFKTAIEINQYRIITLASDRQKFIDQGQSINLFFRAGENVKYVYGVHIKAWKEGLNSLYYQRSQAEARMKSTNTRQTIEVKECEVCQ
ncbi:hypothetical protein [Campylobacter fetus]|uniref:hypothetical protein n=1 Tax=Campylobacter fetus TaxID=196 RepID=UPI000818B280|nr:hypothetical protein [Campylobacter fetus]